MEVCLHTFLIAVRQGLEGAAARDGEEVRGKGEGTEEADGREER